MVLNLHVMECGIISGIVMGMFAMAMNMMGMTSLNLTEYMGCMLTGRKSGIISFIAGFVAHLMASALFAIIYIQIIKQTNLSMNLQTALILGVCHTIFSGVMISVMDSMNPCVADKKVRAMQMFAIGHGTMGMMTYVVAHMLYAFVLMYMLGADVSFGAPRPMPI